MPYELLNMQERRDVWEKERIVLGDGKESGYRDSLPEKI